MNRIALVALIGTLISHTSMADGPAVGYWFVPRLALAGIAGIQDTNTVIGPEALAKIDQSKLDNRAIYRGRFTDRCDLWIQTRSIDLRIDVTDDGKTVDYSVVFSSPQVKMEPKVFKGRVVVGQDTFALQSWEDQEFAIVLKRLNLKQ